MGSAPLPSRMRAAFDVSISSSNAILNQRLTEFTPEEVRCAQITVCANATDADDARDLLQMLGLFCGEIS